MIVYGDVVIDIDLGIGRQYGYRDPHLAELIEQLRPLPPPYRRPAPCHPERPYYALGKCHACYRRERRRIKR